MTWIEPIYNRKQSDVDYAHYLNNKVAQSGLASLSPAELIQWSAGSLIGCLNSGDLNRIESNIQYLSGVLNDYGYKQTMSNKLDWASKDFPYLDELRRIIYNIQILLDTYHPPTKGGKCWAELEHLTWADLESCSWGELEPVKIPLPNPTDRLDYVKVNDIEQILFELKDMIRRMEAEFRRCGTLSCGEEYDL